MNDIEHVVLAADEFLLVRPRYQMTDQEADRIAAEIPAVLRGRVLVFSPDIDVQVVRQL